MFWGFFELFGFIQVSYDGFEMTKLDIRLFIRFCNTINSNT